MTHAIYLIRFVDGRFICCVETLWTNWGACVYHRVRIEAVIMSKILNARLPAGVQFADEETGVFQDGTKWYIAEECDGTWSVLVQAKEIASGLPSRSATKMEAIDWIRAKREVRCY